MRILSKRALVALSVAAAIGAGAAGSAIAANPVKGHPGKHAALKQRATRGIFKVVSDYLELTPKQIHEQLRSGKSLAQIATAQGKTAAGLKQAILDAVKTRLDKAVANGRLTSEREQTFLDRLSTRLDTLLNRTLPVSK